MTIVDKDLTAHERLRLALEKYLRALEDEEGIGSSGRSPAAELNKLYEVHAGRSKLNARICTIDSISVEPYTEHVFHIVRLNEATVQKLYNLFHELDYSGDGAYFAHGYPFLRTITVSDLVHFSRGCKRCSWLG